MSEQLCSCCGAPVDAEGRYEAAAGYRNVTPESDRYEGAQFVSNRNARVAAIDEAIADMRVKHPHGYPGSRNWWRHRFGHDTGCVICGADLPKNQTRGWVDHPWQAVAVHRMYCSNKCRQKAYRIMRKERRTDHARTHE